MDNIYVTVIGGMNADIIGTPYKRPIMGDSNPGKNNLVAGGVGRNIAENITRLGINTKIISAVGNDFFGNFILEYSKSAGIDVDNVIVSDKIPTSTYLCTNNEKGDICFAVSDMEIINLLTPEYIASKIDIINSGKALVIDANLHEDTLKLIAEKVTVPIFADTVSENKAFKYINILRKINTVKVNLLEAELLSDIKINNFQDAKDAAFEIQKKGTENVYLTMGAKGVVFCGDFEAGILPCYKGKIINTTGCGDAFMAALVYGRLRGYNAKKSAKAGLAIASLCAASEKSVSNDITSEKIEKIMEEEPNEFV